MALDMLSSSIGVSKDGMVKVKEGIKLYLIDESAQSIAKNVESLKANIDNYWHGASAKAFALKVETEKAKVITILKVLEQKMEIDLGVMATNSAIADAEVATAIWGLNGGLGGSPNTGGNSAPAPAPQQPTTPEPPTQDLQEDPTSTPEQDNQEAEDIDVDGNEGSSTPGTPTVPAEEAPAPEPETGEPPLPPEEETGEPPLPPEEETGEPPLPPETETGEPPLPPEDETGEPPLPTQDGEAGGEEEVTPPTDPTQVPVAPGEIPGSHSPGTTEQTFPANAHTLDHNSVEYRELVATIYAEATENPDFMVSDTMAVCSVILNRVEAGNWGGSTIHDVISAGGGTGQGQFHGYGAGGRKFDLAMADINNVPAAMREAIDRVLAGERNTSGYSFWGDGVKNHFR